MQAHGVVGAPPARRARLGWGGATPVLALCLVAVAIGAADPRPLSREQLAAIAAFDREVAACQTLLSGPDPVPSEALAQRIAQVHAALTDRRSPIRGIVRDPHPLVDELRARIHLLRRQATQAAQILAPWSARPRFGEDPSSEWPELASADAALALQRLDEALVRYDALAGSATCSAEVRVRAAHGCGLTLEAKGDDARAIDSFDFALRFGRRHLYNPTGAWNWLFARIEGDLARIRRTQEEAHLGRDFLLFREAEHLRRAARDHTSAAQRYQALLAASATGAFSDASRIALALCQVATGAIHAGVRDLQAFTASSPDSLHAGEAWMELARIAVDHGQDPATARRMLDRAKAWLATARTRTVTLQALPMRPAARPLAAGPARERRADLFGNLDREEIRPGMLMNQATCSWYLDDLEERMVTWSGFLHLLAGDKASAKREFQRLGELDRTQVEPSNRSRLQWGADHGYLFAYPQELELYQTPAHRLGILLADLAYVTEDFARAEALADRLLAGGFGKLDGPRRDYPAFLRTQAIFRREGRGAAIRALLVFIEQATHPFTRDRARFTVGSLALDGGKNPEHDRAILHLHQLVTTGEDSLWKWRGQIAWAIYAHHAGRPDVAQATLDRLPKAAHGFREMAMLIKADLAAMSASSATSALRGSATAVLPSGRPSSTHSTTPPKPR